MVAVPRGLCLAALLLVASAEVEVLDTCADAQQLLLSYLESAPPGPRNACAGATNPRDGGAGGDGGVCAAWTQSQCHANATSSECSVGCLRIPGCTTTSPSPAGQEGRVQPDHPGGFEATGTPGACVGDAGPSPPLLLTLT
jgi:hypothetical protein